LSRTIVGMIYGAIVAWIALMIIAHVPVSLPGAIWPAIVVGVSVFFLPIFASADLLSVVPANVYGYAAMAGYTLEGKHLAELNTADHNPLLITAISIVLGAVLGYLMGQFAGILQPKTA
jgi:hypothetical protein